MRYTVRTRLCNPWLAFYCNIQCTLYYIVTTVHVYLAVTEMTFTQYPVANLLSQYNVCNICVFMRFSAAGIGER